MKGVIFMCKKIIAVRDVIWLEDKEIKIEKEDEEFLLDVDNPYIGIKNEKTKALIFAIIAEIDYGIWRNNLTSIIEERLKTNIGKSFEKIKGIKYCPFEKDTFILMVGEEGKAKWKEYFSRTEIKLEPHTPYRIHLNPSPNPSYVTSWHIAPNVTTTTSSSVSASIYVSPLEEFAFAEEIYSGPDIVASNQRGISIEEEQQQESARQEALRREMDIMRGLRISRGER